MSGLPSPIITVLNIAKRLKTSPPEYEMLSNISDDGHEEYVYSLKLASATAVGKGFTMFEARQDASKRMIMKLQQEPESFDLDNSLISDAIQGIVCNTLRAPVAVVSDTEKCQNHVADLRYYCNINGLRQPHFKEIVEERADGPPYTIKCTVYGVQTLGKSTTKKMAKHESANKMLKELKVAAVLCHDINIGVAGDVKETPNENELQMRQLEIIEYKEEHQVMRKMYPQVPPILYHLKAAKKTLDWNPVEKLKEIASELGAEVEFDTTAAQEKDKRVWFYSTVTLQTTPTLQMWNAGLSKDEAEANAAEDTLVKLSIMLTGYEDSKMLLYEVSESTAGVIPFSLYRVLSKWTSRELEDPVYMFLSVLYVLMLECGFSPLSTPCVLDPNERWVQQEKRLKNIHYDINRVQFYTTNFEPFTYVSPFIWRFKIKNLRPLILITDVIPNGNDLLISIKAVQKGSELGLGKCYKLSQYVPTPNMKNFAYKFANMKDLSADFKSMICLARGEALFLEGVCDKATFEALPQHVHETIANYAKKKKSNWPTRLMHKEVMGADYYHYLLQQATLLTRRIGGDLN